MSRAGHVPGPMPSSNGHAVCLNLTHSSMERAPLNKKLIRKWRIIALLFKDRQSHEVRSSARIRFLGEPFQQPIRIAVAAVRVFCAS